MAYQPFYIADLKSGLVKNPEAFLIPQDAFPNLENAYIWRGRIRRKSGYELLDRLRRDLTAGDLGFSKADPWTFNIFTVLGLDASEPNASIDPGTVTIVSGANTYTDAAADGTLVGAPAGSGTIDYATGDVTISGMGFGVATIISMDYFPSLPCMGLRSRELSTINREDLIGFDTKYAYRYNNATDEFEEWITGTTWQGSNSDFFWTTNYWQDGSNRDIFWATNFNKGASPDPIRYSNGVTWTNFEPATGSTAITGEALGNVVTPWTAFGPVNLTNTPVIPTTVVITVAAVAPDVEFTLRDDGDGVLNTSPVSANVGTVDYTTGEVNLTINPALTIDAPVTATYRHGSTFLEQARILIPFKDRLLAFNTWEGTTLAAAIQFPQRVRFSQNGDPTDVVDGWVSDVPGRGGFIDAPTNEHIVSVAFIRDILIIGFERSTWQLRYTGNEILPFVWEKINTELGTESTFSMVSFDGGVLSIGEVSLHSCDGNNVERIDLQIPDEILNIHNSESGPRRVYGIRDFTNQNVYWTFPNDDEARTFPNRMLVYNYLNNTFSIWRDRYTCFGKWQPAQTLRWQDLDDPEVHLWRQWKNPWNWAGAQAFYPAIVGGNQQGFVEILNRVQGDDTSLQVEAIADTTPVRITSVNHNLETNDFVRFSDIIDPNGFADVLNFVAANENVYKIIRIDADNFDLLEYDSTNNVYTDVTLGGAPDYRGNGKIARLSNYRIASKRFNIYETGMKTMLGHIDFLTDRTAAGEFTCQIFVDENDSQAINTGFTDLPADSTNFFNAVVPTSQQQFSVQNSSKNWHRFYCHTDGQSYQYVLTMNDAQMNVQAIQESPLTVHALILWQKDGGRLLP